MDVWKIFNCCEKNFRVYDPAAHCWWHISTRNIHEDVLMSMSLMAVRVRFIIGLLNCNIPGVGVDMTMFVKLLRPWWDLDANGAMASSELKQHVEEIIWSSVVHTLVQYIQVIYYSVINLWNNIQPSEHQSKVVGCASESVITKYRNAEQMAVAILIKLHIYS
jgi:hypothetical protein